ncbi:serine hydrolase domain-containing protein [Komagataeibacter swingsii]|uniref:serine hydrolase domain-containing protein n=1 Tax=Komagataeibacter swingsii TaxID=215220 RepID=UPI001FC9551A|nr:serine hydrolase [Komagataeibacter swingsii]GBQ58291.1 beta-lactamase class C [Komagataeibacter swingsii DSM 16373]
MRGLRHGYGLRFSLRLLCTGLTLALSPVAARAAPDMTALSGQVDLAHWYWGPYNAWSWRHMREIFPSANIPHALMPQPLPDAPARPAAQWRVTDHDGGRVTPLAQVLSRNHVDAFMVMQHGRPVVEWYASPDQQRAPHLIMSMSKSMLGTLAEILIAAGTIDPERQLTSWLPEMRGTNYDGATLRQALDMQISDRVFESEANGALDYEDSDRAGGWLPPHPDSPRDLHAWLATLHHPHGPPGEHFLYLDQGANVVAWVLERATGKPLSTLLTDRIWMPMGARDDAYYVLDRSHEAYASAGMNATLRDMALFAQMMLHGGQVDGRQVVPAAAVDALYHRADRAVWARDGRGPEITQGFPGFEQGGYRSFWYASGESCHRMAAIGLGAQFMLVDPRNDVTAVVLSATPKSDDDAAALAVDYHVIDQIVAQVGGHPCAPSH